MKEYITEAVVLDREPVSESDARISFFTKGFGLVRARATGLYKSVSKLSAHLDPLSIVEVRLVESRGVRVADALRQPAPSRFRTLERLHIFQLVDQQLAEHHPDEQLWQELIRPDISSVRVLTHLGFDPRHARCQRCGNGEVRYFSVQDSSYFCANCAKAQAAREGWYRIKANAKI